MSTEFKWSSDIESILENIRVNCVLMNSQHKKQYLYLKHILRYFRLPIILISGISSVCAVGLQPYIEQQTISVITCMLSLTCGRRRRGRHVIFGFGTLRIEKALKIRYFFFKI